jgi:mono/diheme cytochrome c family protein
VSRWRKVAIAAAVVGAALLPAALYDWGDWFPFERTARALFNGWDMWSTAAVRPFQKPMPQVPSGAVPFGGTPGFAEAETELGRLAPAERARLAALSYRRYCHHCHGLNGDGRIIVGESFDPRVPDLRAPAVQARTDQDLFEPVRHGGKVMIPLADTLTPLETLLAVRHVRELAAAPSRPFLPAQSTRPAE